ncbi:MAG: DNA polymerase/3'-5' exonuclease PolX [Pseudomonadota bacterium]
MKNKDIASIFNQMADLLEVKGTNPFRIRAYRKAAENLEGLTENAADIAARGELEGISGIGKDLAGKIREILKTGILQDCEDLKKEIPPGIITLLDIPGVGPRTARLLFDHFGVTSLEEVEKLALEHKIQGIPGMKAKTEENILKGIAVVKKGRERFPLGLLLPLAREIVWKLEKIPSVYRASIAGSLRRRRETAKDIDLLVASGDPGEVMQAFTALPLTRQILARGDTKASVQTADGFQIDLRVVEPESFGAALCYFTGSKAHNIRIRDMAARRGLKINEYGVFRGDERISGREEEDVFSAVGLPYIEPELREDRGEIEAAQEGSLPVLVEMADIRGDSHIHSRLSDGVASLEDIAQKASALGYSWAAVADHSVSLKVARGLSIQEVREKIRCVHELNERGNYTAKLLCAAEVDIDADGKLDYPDEVLAGLDLVLASIHSGFKQEEDVITRRIISAMKNPYVDIIAHPTGRLLGSRSPYAVNIEKIIQTAAETGTALEINAYFRRLDLNDIYARAAKEKGCLLAIGTDAHSLEQMELFPLGLAVARRAWLEKKDLLNTRDYSELKSHITKKRGRRVDQLF